LHNTLSHLAGLEVLADNLLRRQRRVPVQLIAVDAVVAPEEEAAGQVVLDR